MCKEDERAVSALPNASKQVRAQGEAEKEDRQNRADPKCGRAKQERGLPDPRDFVHQPGKSRHKKTDQRDQTLRGWRQFSGALAHTVGVGVMRGRLPGCMQLQYVTPVLPPSIAGQCTLALDTPRSFLLF